MMDGGVEVARYSVLRDCPFGLRYSHLHFGEDPAVGSRPSGVPSARTLLLL